MYKLHVQNVQMMSEHLNIVTSDIGHLCRDTGCCMGRCPVPRYQPVPGIHLGKEVVIRCMRRRK